MIHFVSRIVLLTLMAVFLATLRPYLEIGGHWLVDRNLDYAFYLALAGILLIWHTVVKHRTKQKGAANDRVG